MYFITIIIIIVITYYYNNYCLVLERAFQCKCTLQREKKMEVNHYSTHMVQNILKETKFTLKNMNTGIQNKNCFPLQTLDDVIEIEKKLKDSVSNHLIIVNKYLIKYSKYVCK